MSTDIRLIVLDVNFWIMAVTMATLHLMTCRYILIFGLNSFSDLYFPSVNFFYFCHIMNMILPDILKW